MSKHEQGHVDPTDETREVREKLRDIFAPLCDKFARSVEVKEPAALREEADAIEHTPLMADYGHPEDEIVEPVVLDEKEEKVMKENFFRHRIIIKPWVLIEDGVLRPEALEEWQGFKRIDNWTLTKNLIEKEGIEGYITYASEHGWIADPDAFRIYVEKRWQHKRIYDENERQKNLQRARVLKTRNAKFEEYIETLPSGKKKDMGAISRNIGLNLINGEDRLESIPHAHFLSFVWGGIDGVPITDIGIFPFYIVVPVGAHGKDFAERLYRTTQVLMQESYSLIEEGEGIFKDNQKTLERYTARGRGGDESDPRPAPIRTLDEGILTITQVVSLLMAEKIAGYDDPHKFLAQIVKQDLITKLTKAMPMGVIGPLILSGRYIADILKLGSDGTLIFNKESSGLRAIFKIKIRQEQHPGVDSTGRGCPVSFTGDEGQAAGITVLSRAYLKVFEAISS